MNTAVAIIHKALLAGEQLEMLDGNILAYGTDPNGEQFLGVVMTSYNTATKLKKKVILATDMSWDSMVRLCEKYPVDKLKELEKRYFTR